MRRFALLLAPLLLLSSCQTPAPATQDRFALADANADGKLTRNEVSDFVVHNAFGEHDANNDKKLSTSEWLPGNDLALFKKRDTNGDGFISLDEALAWGRSTDKGWGEMMKKGDTNGDGSISRAEATAYYGSKEGPIR